MGWWCRGSGCARRRSSLAAGGTRAGLRPRGLAAGKVELTSRRTGAAEEMTPEEAVARIGAIYAGL